MSLLTARAPHSSRAFEESVIKGLSVEAQRNQPGTAQCPRPSGAGRGRVTGWESVGWVGKTPDRNCGLRHTHSSPRTPARGSRINPWPPPPAALRLLPGPLAGCAHHTRPRESAGGRPPRAGGLSESSSGGGKGPGDSWKHGTSAGSASSFLSHRENGNFVTEQYFLCVCFFLF